MEKFYSNQSNTIVIYSADKSKVMMSISFEENTFLSDQGLLEFKSSPESLYIDLMNESRAHDLVSGVTRITSNVDWNNNRNQTVQISFLVNKTLINQDTSNYCLAYIDLISNTWICEDLNLIIEDYEEDRYNITGKTTHFTDFAVLVTGNQTYTSSSGSNNVLTIAVSVSVGVFIIIVTIGFVSMILITKRWRREELDAMSSSTSKTRSFIRVSPTITPIE